MRLATAAALGMVLFFSAACSGDARRPAAGPTPDGNPTLQPNAEDVAAVEEAMYPDFVVLRLDYGGALVVDVLDPHTTSLTDAPAKAVGLAEYARDHGKAFGRIECVIVDTKKRLFRLDLQKAEVRNEVLKVSSSEHLEAQPAVYEVNNVLGGHS